MIRAAVRNLMPSSGLGYNLPDEAWFNYARGSSKYTPDIAKLEEFAFQLYFACDESQTGHSKHNLLGGYEYKCPGFTQKSFNYWDPNTPFLPPIPMETEAFRNPLAYYPPIAKIKGQILLVRPSALINLDEYKENGVQYQRVKSRIIVPHRALKWVHDTNHPPDDVEICAPNGLGLTFERMCVIRAWMYVGIPKYWDNLISAMDYGAVQTYQSKNRRWCPEYYQLRRPQK